MAKCPYCEQETEHLVCYSRVNISDRYSYDMNTDALCCERRIFTDTNFVLIFKCPRCGEALFFSIDKAKEFLKKG